MNPDILERLLIDQALGQLTPDMVALLDAYQSDHPAVGPRASGLERTVRLAGDVLRTREIAALPPFPAARIRSASNKRYTLRVVRDVSALAATLVFGVLLGTRVLTPSAAIAPRPTERSLPVVQVTPAQRPTTGDDFWSAARLYQTACNAKHGATTRLVWDSPIERPKLRGEL
jgi:hypothetical protein